MRNVLDDYKEYLKEKGKAKNTIEGYGYDIKPFIKYLNKIKKNLSDIQSEDVFNYISSINVSNSTMYRFGISLKSFCTYLKSQGIIKEIPICNYGLNITTKNPDYISKDDINKILQLMDKNTFIGIRDYCIIKLLYCTGMRITELLNLKSEDVDLDNKLITIHSKKDRIIRINEDMKQSLIKYFKFKTTLIVNGDDEIFVNTNGGKLTRQSGYSIFQKYCEKAELKENYNLNTLKNSFVINCIKNKMQYNDIQKIMGLDNLNFLNKYSKIIEENISDQECKNVEWI